MTRSEQIGGSDFPVGNLYLRYTRSIRTASSLCADMIFWKGQDTQPSSTKLTQFGKKQRL